MRPCVDMVILFPPSLMVDLPQVFGLTSFRNLCKFYKSLIKKWARSKNSSANESQVEPDLEAQKVCI